ncbi:GIY-YIG nuclease family protein [Hymenobacter cellulosilyticus]|uniref:GIY-YIG nuclease family protein n=1 Tax=Hymenobacter cellulosilyticus TaxID=2932248 RepID=A0A8T9QDW6_9BACT|nr:GIY-YIG nuclease family protein [Hymenobacter cellulosilyticus]UOQ74601.1 GIY-YIG nuclease family protein [Hymenobacter cellulosilyticus]
MLYYIYILTNLNHAVLYVGVTNDLKRRVYEHKTGLHPGFTSKYNLHKLVYWEQFTEVKTAIDREKQLKGGSRQSKLDLIQAFNPEWRELFEELG